MIFAVRLRPHAADFNLALVRGQLGRLPPLLVHVCLDHLGRQTGCQPAVLATLEQHAHDDIRIAPRRESHEPSVLCEIFIVLMLRAHGQRDNLGRPGLAGNVDSRNVRRGSRALRQQHAPHRVRDRVPSRGINWNILHFGIACGLNVPRRQLRWINDVRHHHPAVRRDRRDRAHQLHRSNRHRSLADANRNRFSGEPLLLEIADLPFFRRHHAAHFVGQIDPSLLAQSKDSRVFCDAVDTQLFRQRIKENIARLVDRLRKVHWAVTAFHPASEAPAIKVGAPAAVHVEGLGNPFLPARRRHNDLERRAGRQLRLNRFIQQRLVRIIHQLVPLVPRNLHGEVVRIKGRPAHHRQNFPGVRIHGDDGAVLPFDGLLRRNL